MTFSWPPATGGSAVWWRLQASGSTRWTYPSSPRPTAAPPACPCSSDRTHGACLPCESFAFHGRAAIRSGAGDLGNEGGRDPGGDGAPNPGEAIAGQRLSPAPSTITSSRPEAVPAPRALDSPTLGELSSLPTSPRQRPRRRSAAPGPIRPTRGRRCYKGPAHSPNRSFGTLASDAPDWLRNDSGNRRPTATASGAGPEFCGAWSSFEWRSSRAGGAAGPHVSSWTPSSPKGCRP